MTTLPPEGVIGQEVDVVIAKVATGAPALKTWTKATVTPLYEKHPYAPATGVDGFIGVKTGYSIDGEFLFNLDEGWPFDVGDYILAAEAEHIESGDPLLFTDMLDSAKWGYMVVTEAPRTLERGAATGTFKCETGQYKRPPVVTP